MSGRQLMENAQPKAGNQSPLKKGWRICFELQRTDTHDDGFEKLFWGQFSQLHQIKSRESMGTCCQVFLESVLVRLPSSGKVDFF